ncbi:MAG: acyltransferase [Prevotella sp.]|nr:acyltransferase [Prevotella sp.]
MEKTKIRESNIELLRIIAMFLILVVHASFRTLDPPTSTEIHYNLCSSFLRCFSESFSIISVNLFILISGWFGIKTNFIRLCSLIFQIYFIGIIMYVFLRIFGNLDAINAKDLKAFILIKDHWFIKSYIVLYIFAPILNAFINNSSQQQIKYFLIAFFTIQTVHGYSLISDSNWFSDGYSPLSFMGLYVLARYMRLYPNKFTRFNKHSDLLIFFTITMLLTFLTLLHITRTGRGWAYYAYSSPLVILSSIYFFLFFTKFSFKNKIINWIAVSSFAVYIVHCSFNFFSTFFSNYIKEWFDTRSSIVFMIYTTGWLLLVFLSSVLLDKFRIYVWNMILNKLNKTRITEKSL